MRSKLNLACFLTRQVLWYLFGLIWDKTGSSETNLGRSGTIIVWEIGGGGGGILTEQALIVMNVYILPRRTQKPESTWKNVSGNIWGVGALKLISPIGLLAKFKSFLLRLLRHWSHFLIFCLKALLVRVCWPNFKKNYKKKVSEKKVNFFRFFQKGEKNSKLKKK